MSLSSVSKSLPPVPERADTRQERRVDLIPETQLEMLRKLSALEETKTKRIPSSTLLQLMLYGETFNVVTVNVEIDYSEFTSLYKKLYENLVNAGTVIPPALRGFYYSRFWRTPVSMSQEDVAKLVNEIAEPVRNAWTLQTSSFSLGKGGNYNPKFAEVLETYVMQERIHGYSFYDPADRSLTVYAKIRGSQKTMDLSDALTDYYVLLRLEPQRIVYGCTCPHSRGETRDRNGRPIPPEFTGMCKHVLAALYHFAPIVFAYLSSPKYEKSFIEERLVVLRQAFDEMNKRAKEKINALAASSQTNPQSPDEETPARVVLSNLVYLVFKGLADYVDHFNLHVVKLAPSTKHLHEFENLWNSIKVIQKEGAAEGKQDATASDASQLAEMINTLEKNGLYNRIEELRGILNGLQGSMITTPYTDALLCGCVLGSNLYTDPVIVASVGDPGTGKTLTASMLGELVGFRSIVIEREVSATDVVSEAKQRLEHRLTRILNLFERVIAPKIPDSSRDEARRIYREILSECLSMHDLTPEAAKKMSLKLADLLASSIGLDQRLKSAVAKTFYEAMRYSAKMYSEYSSGRALKARVVEARREMLEVLEKAGIISSAEEKEKLNSGSVRWDVLQTADGYKILVYIDLHYLLSKYSSKPDLLVEKLKEISGIGKTSLVVQRGGVAEIKLSEVAYLEKMLRTREEDITGRLIWVGGEVTRKSVVLIDEARRAPQLVTQLLTDLSKSARDSRRTNLIITSDNAEATKEAKLDPNLDAYHSRINFEVVTPSTTVEAHIDRALKSIAELDATGRLPLVTMDELYVLHVLSKHVKVPDRFIQIAHAVPLLTIYDFKVMRPETARAKLELRAPTKDPLIVLIPKGSIAPELRSDYETPRIGSEDLPDVMRKPERRFGHHVMRAARALAILEKKTEVDADVFLRAVSMVLTPRIAPVNVSDPYSFVDYTTRIVDSIVDNIRAVIGVDKTSTEKLIDVMASLSKVPSDLFYKALDEMSENPVLTALFCRFLAQVLVSKKAAEFVEYAKSVPGLHETLKLISRYEKLPIRVP